MYRIIKLTDINFLMKKYLFALFGVLSLILTCACHNRATFKIGISQCSSDDWRDKMNNEVIREAMLHDDVEVVIRSADDNSQKQIEDIEFFVNNNFDIIIVAPNEAAPLTPELKKVYDSGIPIIVFDRNINDTTYTQRISVDNRSIGETAAKYALNLIDAPLKVIEISGLPGSTPAIERAEGFRNIILQENGEIIASKPADWQQDKSYLMTDSLLKIYPETNLIYAHNDRMAIGARKASESNGLKNIKIIGIDGAPEIGIKGVADGLIDATFLYPSEGNRILKEAIKILRGEPYEKEILIPATSAVDSTNADILLKQNELLEEDTEKVLILKGQLDDYLSKHSAQTFLLYACILITLLLFAFLFLILRNYWQTKQYHENLKNQNKLLEEERDKQKELNLRLEEATQSKLSFFTNVSHDLRTPLTLIAEPVEQLSRASNLNEGQQTLVKLANKNVKILNRLINQILDFRKYESNKMKLNLTEIDFREALNEWTESFSSVARKRDIKLILEQPEGDEPLLLAIDVEKIESVFFNLMSNAIKYSPDNSKIVVSYKFEGDTLKLVVADNGEGIRDENIPHIFDRFFQVDRIRPKGSGIGLWLVKVFVDLHGGSISVESELGKGTVFTVILPVKHIAETVSDFTSNLTPADVYNELDEIDQEIEFSDEKPLLLIIDDNNDIRKLVAELMQDQYNVINAKDGQEGMRKAIKYVPDIIICDVMMPGIDGMEVCSRLKEEPITSHIPVLMLTACGLDEQRVQGFESGADGYISKPFSSEVLKANAASMIRNRRKIKELYGVNPVKNAGQAGNESKPDKGEIDNEFYNSFLSVFESRMSDPDINVESLASEMGLERTQLYRKIKAITNYSPVELMRNLRLKKAKRLLKTTDKTVSEICYEVGFSNPAYFTKCYKERYGETPSETRTKI